VNILYLCNVQKNYKVTNDSSLKTGLFDNLPEGMLEEHGNMAFAVDIMYINKIHSS